MAIAVIPLLLTSAEAVNILNAAAIISLAAANVALYEQVNPEDNIFSPLYDPKKSLGNGGDPDPNDPEEKKLPIYNSPKKVTTTIGTKLDIRAGIPLIITAGLLMGQAALATTPQRRYDPLLVDLDGDGIETTTSDNGILFDLDKTFAEKLDGRGLYDY